MAVGPWAAVLQVCAFLWIEGSKARSFQCQVAERGLSRVRGRPRRRCSLCPGGGQSAGSRRLGVPVYFILALQQSTGSSCVSPSKVPPAVAS